MPGVLVNSLLSLLLIATSFFGGCISCEQFFMWPGAKSCCAPDGQCRKKEAPGKQASSRECKQLAFDHQKSDDDHIDLPVILTAAVELPLRGVEALSCWYRVNTIEPSPPDLQILHSTFLI